VFECVVVYTIDLVKSTTSFRKKDIAESHTALGVEVYYGTLWYSGVVLVCNRDIFKALKRFYKVSLRYLKDKIIHKITIHLIKVFFLCYPPLSTKGG